MKPVPFPQIIGAAYTLDSINAECQRCVNMFAEPIETGKGRGSHWLKPTPGLQQFCDLGASPVRDIYSASNGRVFAVGGDNLYELLIDGSKILLGITSTSIEKAQLIDNGQLLFIVRGPLAYTLRFSDNDFLALTDANYLGSGFIDFMDQYVIVNIAGTQQFQISPLAYNRVVAWSAGDVFSAESSPDKITALVVNGRELWLFGPNSYEVWFNTGDGLRPFQRIRDAAFNVGTVAPNSVKSIAGQVFWLGGAKEGSGIIWTSNGYQPTRVSTFGIESQIANATAMDDAQAWSYQLKGHFFYVLNCPSLGKTFAYNITTKLWNELEYRVPVYDTRLQHRACCQAFGFNKNLVGDFLNGKIYELSDQVYSDNGDPIIRYRRSPHVNSGQRTIFYEKLELVVETGVGLVSGQGSDPLISMRFSDNYGHTWSNYRTKSIGKIGKYRQSVVFNKCGSSKDKIFEIQISDPVPFRIIGAELGLIVGVH